MDVTQRVARVRLRPLGLVFRITPRLLCRRYTILRHALSAQWRLQTQVLRLKDNKRHLAVQFWKGGVHR